MKVLIVDSHHEDMNITVSAIKIPWPDAEITQHSSGKDGLEDAGKDQFDITIVDLDMPDMTGFEFLETLYLFSSKPTIVLKKDLNQVDIIRSLQLGADECFAKPLNQLDFIAKSQAVFRRYVGRSEISNLTIGKLRLEADVHRAHLDGQEIALTREENIILYRLMSNCGHVTSYNSVARAVWGNDLTGANSALRICVQRLRRKLPRNNSMVQIITERGVGFRLVAAK